VYVLVRKNSLADYCEFKIIIIQSMKAYMINTAKLFRKCVVLKNSMGKKDVKSKMAPKNLIAVMVG